MPWSCVYTYGGCEGKAVENLEKQDFQVVFPTIRVRNQKNLAERISKPLFPCYLFLHLSTGQRWHSVNSTRGVIRLLATLDRDDPRPLFLPDGMIEKWRTPQESKYEMPAGTIVRVRDRSNPLFDLEGRVEELTSSERVRVLISIFNRDVLVTFESPEMLDRV